MTESVQSMVRPSDDVVETGVADETVLLHLGNGTYYGLNPVGTLIWAWLKEGLSEAAMIERLQAEFHVPRQQAVEDARRFIADLMANDILVIEPRG